MKIQMEIPDDQAETLIKMALIHGWVMRKNPSAAWTLAEKKEFVRAVVGQLVRTEHTRRLAILETLNPIATQESHQKLIKAAGTLVRRKQ